MNIASLTIYPIEGGDIRIETYCKDEIGFMIESSANSHSI